MNSKKNITLAYFFFVFLIQIANGDCVYHKKIKVDLSTPSNSNWQTIGLWNFNVVNNLSDGKVIARDASIMPTAHSRHNHHLTIHDGDQNNGWGATLVNSMPGFGRALKLDGINDYISSFTTFPIKDSFAFDFWINVERKTGENVWLVDMPNVWSLTLENDCTRINLYIWDENDTAYRIRKSFNPGLGWQHISVGYRDGKAWLQVMNGDGGVVNLDAPMKHIGQNTHFTIGARSNRTGFLQGLIDDIHWTWPNARISTAEEMLRTIDDPVARRGTSALLNYYHQYKDSIDSYAQQLSSYNTNRPSGERWLVNWAYASLVLFSDEEKIARAEKILADLLRAKATVFSDSGYEWDPMYWELKILARLINTPALKEKITDDTQQLIRGLLWDFVSTLQRDGICDWRIENLHTIFKSDNHDLKKRVVFLLTAQALKNDPRWSNVKYADGSNPETNYVRWRDNLIAYFRLRAGAGLDVEFGAPGYAGVRIGPMFILHDVVEDDFLAALVSDFLDLYFADVAQEVLYGIRGGAKVRTYKTRNSFVHTGDNLLFYNHLTAGQPENLHSLISTDSFAAAYTNYRLPEAVRELMTQPDAKGSYEYKSRRLGQGGMRLVDFGLKAPDVGPVYEAIFPPSILRTSFATPAWVLGTFTLDEAKSYMLISSQNHWMGLITTADPDSRIVVSATPSAANDAGRTGYRELQAAQRENVAVFRKQLVSDHTARLRLYVSDDFRMEERPGLLLFENQRVHVAVSVRQPNRRTGYQIAPSSHGPGRYITFDMPNVFLAMEVFDKDKHSSLEEFGRVLATNSFEFDLAFESIRYQSLSSGCELTMFSDLRLPQINGEQVNLFPKKVYDSPWLKSVYGSGVVEINSPSGKKISLDFNVNTD